MRVEVVLEKYRWGFHCCQAPGSQVAEKTKLDQSKMTKYSVAVYNGMYQYSEGSLKIHSDPVHGGLCKKV